ncbi:MAG: hypothetical protein AAF250_08965 [Pseudomonadota bacterium]
MKNANMVAIDLTEIECVTGGVGGLPSEPTIQDLIDLADRADEVTRWRLGIED